MRDKAFNIAKNPRRNPKSMMDINAEFLQWFTIFFINKSASREDISASAGRAKSKIISNQELSEELHKPVIRKFEEKKYTHLLKIIFGVLI